MQQGEPQNKQESQRSLLIPWAIAAIFISVLSACFIASCLVTHQSFLHCQRGAGAHTLPGHREDCFRDKLEQKGSIWTCCPPGWEGFHYNCYLPLSNNKTWAESEKDCVNMGAHLASISTETEQNFIIQLLNRQFSYYLGLKDGTSKGQWHWVDQTPFNPHMVFWHKGEPNSSQKESCAAIVNHQDKWAWKNFPCSFETSRICKRRGTELK